jgi:aspartate/methionine/tyrosine aminotransferase
MSVSPARRLARIPRSGIRAAIERPFADVVDLAGGDPNFATPAHIVEAAAQAARRGETHYTHGRGEPELRAAFAEQVEQENGFADVDPQAEVVVTAGGLNGLAATFQALLDPGEEVLVPDPGFANYAAQVLLAGGSPRTVPLSEESGWAYDFDALADAVGPHTRLLVVNSPSNPTGAVLALAQLEQLTAFAAQHDLILVSDEAYEQLVYRGSHRSLATVAGARERTVSVFSLSKSHAMSGWRIGFVVAPPALSDEIAKVQEHLIGCPSSVSQAAAIAALSGPRQPLEAMREECRRRRDLVVDAFASCRRAQLVPPAGSLYAFPKIDSGDAEPAEWLLSEARVQVVPGRAFGPSGGAHVRLSFAGDAERLAQGLERLQELLA